MSLTIKEEEGGRGTNNGVLDPLFRYSEPDILQMPACTKTLHILLIFFTPPSNSTHTCFLTTSQKNFKKIFAWQMYSK